MSLRPWAVAGAVLALLGVAGGAFGAHLLGDRISATRLDTFETAVRYQMYHALGLLVVGLAGRPTPGFVWAGRLFVAGILIFSGSLYTLVLTGIGWWGAVTPVGGACFLAGWAALATALVREPDRRVTGAGAPQAEGHI